MLLFKNSTLLAFGLLLTLASCGGGGGDDGGADVDAVDDSVPPPVVKTFKTFQSADAVIGQPDFTSGLANQGGSPGANTLNQAVGAPAAGNFYVLDPSNSRILGFNTIPATNNASAQRLLDLGEKSVYTSYTHAVYMRFCFCELSISPLYAMFSNSKNRDYYETTVFTKLFI